MVIKEYLVNKTKNISTIKDSRLSRHNKIKTAPTKHFLVL